MARDGLERGEKKLKLASGAGPVRVSRSPYERVTREVAPDSLRDSIGAPCEIDNRAPVSEGKPKETENHVSKEVPLNHTAQPATSVDPRSPGASAAGLALLQQAMTGENGEAFHQPEAAPIDCEQGGFTIRVARADNEPCAVRATVSDFQRLVNSAPGDDAQTVGVTLDLPIEIARHLLLAHHYSDPLSSSRSHPSSAALLCLSRIDTHPASSDPRDPQSIRGVPDECSPSDRPADDRAASVLSEASSGDLDDEEGALWDGDADADGDDEVLAGDINVTVHRNGYSRDGCRVVVPADPAVTLGGFCETVAEALGCGGRQFRKVFTRSGVEIESLDELCDNDVLWFSEGESFQFPFVDA
mmetsp:Transcript_18253/g.46035  ORF Transcript_18253/g.46035 Transcript_18253/m.46035 type:complete len:358 (-) Transcript_18253:112-1185(-)